MPLLWQMAHMCSQLGCRAAFAAVWHVPHKSVLHGTHTQSDASHSAVHGALRAVRPAHAKPAGAPRGAIAGPALLALACEPWGGWVQ
jgi:hypothetical protein